MKKLFLLLATLALTNAADATSHRKKATSHLAPLQLKNKLVFTRGNRAVHFMVPGNEVVWTMNSDGSGQKSVWRVPKGYGRFGGFNLNGTQALSYNRFNVYLHDLKTRRLRHLFVHSSGWGTYINSTSFSRDGKRVVFVAGGANTNELSTRVCIFDLRNPPRTVEKSNKLGLQVPPESNGDMHEPRISSDGLRLVVSTGTRHSDSEMFSGAWNIWTINVDSSMPRRVTSNPDALEKLAAFDKAPCFSPDDRQIAFVRRVFFRDKGESNDIFIVDADGQNERRVTNYHEAAQSAGLEEFKSRLYNQISDLFFSSDGKQIAFNQTDREDGIYSVDKDGKNLKRLTTGTLVQWVW